MMERDELIALRYLAADTGVTGTHVDVAVPTHTEALDLGVRTAEVWVVEP